MGLVSCALSSTLSTSLITRSSRDVSSEYHVLLCAVCYMLCVVLCYMLCVMCYMLCVMCCLLCVICYMLCGVCYVLHVKVVQFVSAASLTGPLRSGYQVGFTAPPCFLDTHLLGPIMLRGSAVMMSVYPVITQCVDAGE